MEVLNQHICPVVECSKLFKARKSLTEHMRIHNGEKPYKCHFEGCEKRFTQYSSMQKHERTHTGDKPYKCQICEKDFTQISNLKRHERVHAGEKPHECGFCQKKFSTASNLKQHIHVHERGEFRTRFLCKICQKTYLYRSSLRKHLQDHGMHDIGNGYDNELFIEIKVEQDYDDNNFQFEDNFMVKEEEEIYPEPDISKYIFVDQDQAIKAISSEPVEFKVEASYLNETDESQRAAAETQETSSVAKMTFDLFPNSPIDCLNKNAEPEPETKMLSLSSLLGSPLRDRDCKDSFWDAPFASSKPKTSTIIINYKGELYYLYDKTLNRTKPNGELVMRQIEDDFANPSRSYHQLPEISHYPDFQSLLKVYKEIVAKYSDCITLEMLLSDKNCNSLTCKGNVEHSNCKNCNHHTTAEDSYEKFIGGESPSLFDEVKPSSSFELTDFSLDDNSCERSRVGKSQNEKGHMCLCDITKKYKHVHGPKCGHIPIMHDGHVDYIVDGKLHHPDGDHCDDHGQIFIVENSSNEYAMSLISNNYPQDNKYSMDCKFSLDCKFPPMDYKYQMDFKF